MITGEQLQFKDALLITYSKDGTTVGKVCLKKNHENFLDTKKALIEKLEADEMVYKCEDILYYSEEQIQEYVKNLKN